MRHLLGGNPCGRGDLPALDVGCGPGGALLDLQRLRPTVGLDLSAEALFH
ncbi:MAG TPA: class I SAM-dependent methyltransferase, partial [Armatimonadetes bacterium]|nr:class I SAM-dependent methyltransferase [Armatimonadota bacterium]